MTMFNCDLGIWQKEKDTKNIKPSFKSMFFNFDIKYSETL